MSQNTIRKKPRLNRKFRFQLLAQWIFETYKPCKLADIGGGKGLLSYLLNQKGFESTVIDPFWQHLPYKYKDLDSSKQIKLTQDEMNSIPRITKPFENEMAKEFDLLVGLHAHGSNMQIIQACKEYGKNFVLLPCCVIDEPIIKQPGINWFESLVEYAEERGFEVKRAKINFKGQNNIIYTQSTSGL